MRTNKEIWVHCQSQKETTILELMAEAQRQALEEYRRVIIADIPVIRGRRFNSININRFINNGQIK